MFEPNSNKPLALISGGQLYFYQLDQLGTPLSLTDSENNIVWQAHYSVFGEATLTVNKIDNPIRFQGQYYDSESGLHYNHFRYYDPQTGRFISQDPIGLLGGNNHYQYAPNHINWIDPLGLMAKPEDCSTTVGKAYIYQYGQGRDVHFAVVVKTKNWTVGTEQLGGIGTKTLISEFDPLEPSEKPLTDIIEVTLPNAKQAINYQKRRIYEDDQAFSMANYNVDELSTPDYDPVNQSCLTHVFDVLNEGGIEDAPKSSEANLKTAKYLKSLKNRG